MNGERRIGYVSFSAQRLEMLRNGWLQARYYSDSDSTRVRDFLSYDDVYEVNPFEIGVRGRGREKKVFRERFGEVVRLLDLKDLLSRAFVSLSNGEMRRVMLARELLTAPEILEMDDPYNGLDPEQCARLTELIAALRARDVEVVVRGDAGDVVEKRGGEWRISPSSIYTSGHNLKPAVVAFKDVTVKYGRRMLYRHFSWTVREGERWVLRGRNGSGKTTLMALVTGDSPLAYGLDVSVFGQRRDIGCDLHAMRKKIAMVSPEMQAYLGKDPETLLTEALQKEPKLLILDEPCMNLDLKAARKLCAKVSAYLMKNPKTTAICIAHRPEHVPAGFDRELNLDSETSQLRRSEGRVIGDP